MIHYEKYGNGDHAVLLLPGALGTTQTDFSPQLEHLNREKLTIVAWDPPGYGYSRPPDRKFDMDMFEKDATLGFEKFSLVGWSDGGITSLIIASRFQSAINKMVVFGANSYVSKKDVDLYEGIRDIEKWSERMISPMINLYGKEYFKKCWESWCDMCAEILVNKDGDLCQNGLKDITCPTLIIQGEKDPIAPGSRVVRVFTSRVLILGLGFEVNAFTQPLFSTQRAPVSEAIYTTQPPVHYMDTVVEMRIERAGQFLFVIEMTELKTVDLTTLAEIQEFHSKDTLGNEKSTKEDTLKLKRNHQNRKYRKELQ
ncbi:Valacyclovir hydrolase [Nymphon striatum]|nr:Valacyclovir hydrolase [Nymphon striatum]